LDRVRAHEGDKEISVSHNCRPLWRVRRRWN
jgi:hypothetical protein